MAELMPLKDAQDILISSAKILASEDIDIAHSCGRIASQDIYALRTQPASNMSAMDGYAIIHKPHTIFWNLNGECKAGHPASSPLEIGQTARIFTGALLPEGADTVIMQEDAEYRDNKIILNDGVYIKKGQNIRPKGNDFQAGDIIIKVGTIISPAHIAQIIAAGHAKIKVYKQPSIAIISTGDELIGPGKICAPHQIPSSNGPMIAAMIDKYDIRYNDTVMDDLDSICGIISNTQDCNIIITIGGASVGDYDLILPALKKLGASIEFMKVAIKPGKPIMVAKLGETIIIGLPGNPSSAFVTATLFLLPLLRYMTGHTNYLPIMKPAISANILPSTGPRAEFVRGLCINGEVKGFDKQDSAKFSTLSSANALIYRPSHSEQCPKNSLVHYISI